MIRVAERSDLPAMLELCRLHAAHEGLAFADSGQIARWDRALFAAQPRLFAWVVAVGDDLDGYMTATIDYSTWRAAEFVYLDCLYLRPDARGRRVGRRLIRTLQAFAAARGIAELQWQTAPANRSGMAFYAAIGAMPLSKIRYALPVPAPAQGVAA